MLALVQLGQYSQGTYIRLLWCSPGFATEKKAKHALTVHVYLCTGPGRKYTLNTCVRVDVAYRCFDVLYVVDPYRAWYDGGEVGLMHERYTDRLRQYTEQYRHVVMIGDSMGASAALLFSPLATKVMSFCPQVGCCPHAVLRGQPQASEYLPCPAVSTELHSSLACWQQNRESACPGSVCQARTINLSTACTGWHWP